MGSFISDGGNAGRKSASAALKSLQGKAMLAVPMEGCRRPRFFEAQTIDEFAAEVPQKYKVPLRHTDGLPAKETVEIKSLGDVDLKTIIQKSPTLKAQAEQQKFLARLQHELQSNPAFRQEITAILKDEKRKTQLLNSLRQMQALLQKNQAPVLDFLLND